MGYGSGLLMRGRYGPIGYESDQRHRSSGNGTKCYQTSSTIFFTRRNETDQVFDIDEDVVDCQLGQNICYGMMTLAAKNFTTVNGTLQQVFQLSGKTTSIG